MTSDASTLRPHGGYRRLRSFQVTEIIYDGTVAFCERIVNNRSRTRDQMEKQNGVPFWLFKKLSEKEWERWHLRLTWSELLVGS